MGVVKKSGEPLFLGRDRTSPIMNLFGVNKMQVEKLLPTGKVVNLDLHCYE